jgi:hypothetical protein
MAYETVSYLSGMRANPVLWPQHSALGVDDAVDGVGMGANFGQGSSAQAWTTADLVHYAPIRVKRHVIAVKLWFGSEATGTNNIDIGIFNRAGTKIISTGLVAKPASNTCSVQDITDTPLAPDLYYMGMTCVSATATFNMWNLTNAPDLSAQGFRTEQLGAGAALPSTATWIITSSHTRCPRMGIVVDSMVA